MADLLRELDLDFIALNPGSSYRGLHDSLVNHLGNSDPQLLLCLHEEHAVALAHGYAKVTDRPMAVALHSNVGLMHASMAIFNAYCDRVPILILGATGPLDADRRRPWIDWLHTAVDQAALIRPFVKWDDQPLSVPAALDAIAQAHRLAGSVPQAPTYVCLDTSLQEGSLTDAPKPPAIKRFGRALPAAPDAATVRDIVARLTAAKRPVMLVGRVSRSERGWQERIALAERLNAQVFTHQKLAAAFPTSHPLHAEEPHVFTSPRLSRALRDADVVLALDWLDLGGTLSTASPVEAHVVSVSLDTQLHSGWGKESQAPVPADSWVPADVDAAVTAILGALEGAATNTHPSPATGMAGRTSSTTVDADPKDDELAVADIADALALAVGDGDSSLVRVPNGWSGDLWPIDHPLDVLGADGGEGIGSGPGMIVGAALALRDTDRLPVAVLGDGDYVMGSSAFWTAAHYGIGLLVIVANNRSFFNDEIHQHQVAEHRGRPTENRWIGQHITGPDIDLSSLARAQGLTAYGPITDRTELRQTIASAVAQARAGAAVVVDVRISSDVAHETSRAVTQVNRR